MKYFSMTDGINCEMLGKFIKFFNDYSQEPCSIVINSRGGSSYVSETIVHMISEMTDCTLIIHGVYSAAFEIAIEAKCKKLLSKFPKGMMHIGRLDVNVALDGKPYYDEDANHFKNFPVERKLMYKLAKRILTKPELIKYNKREEVWFDFKRMKEILPDAKIIK